MGNMKEITAIINLLGDENVERIKKELCNLLIKRFRDDLEDYSNYLLYPPDFFESTNDALESTAKKITKMYKDAVVEINQDYIDKMKSYMAGQFDPDKKLRHDVIKFIKKWWWRGNEYSDSYKMTRELAEIVKATQTEIETETED